MSSAALAIPKVPADGLLLIVNFEQAHEIEPFLSEVLVYFPQSQCVLVDDGSRDGSTEIAEKMGFKVLRHEKNRGVGATIRTGLDYGRREGYRWVLITASNGKMVPSEFSRIFLPLARGEADYVQGNRFHRGGASPGLPLFRRLMIPLFSLLTSICMGKWFQDITCGLRGYTFEVLKAPGMDLSQAWLDHYELEYYLHFKVVRARRYRMIEVPVTMRYDRLAPNRQSKIRPFSGWWSMMRPFVYLALRIRN